MEFYLPKLIGLCGRKGSGKDTAAKALERDYGYKIIKFAGPLKAMTAALLKAQGASDLMIERMIEGDLKEVASGLLAGRTPRFVMQTLGTEWGRDIIGTTFWTQAFVNQLNLEDNSRYVCTDMRFPNEVDLIRGLGGYTARIVRNVSKNEFSDHPSEKLIDTLPVMEEIHNDLSISILEDKIKTFTYGAFHKYGIETNSKIKRVTVYR